MPTNFPTAGEDMAITLGNSNYPQFSRAYAEELREGWPDIWAAGGNIRGNEAYQLWGQALGGSEAEEVLSWIKEREAWSARHFEDGAQFKEDLSPNLSNVAGLVAQIKWGVVGTLGESLMRSTLDELKTKLEDRSAVEARPYPNEHAARLEDPAKYDSFARVNDAFGDGIDAIYGIKEGVSELQAIRFDKDKYTAEEAKQWLEEHDFEPILFEPVIEESFKMDKRHIKEIYENENSYVIVFAKPEHVEPVAEPAPMAEPQVSTMHEEEYKAAPGELAVGDLVRWISNERYVYGRVLLIESEGEITADSGFTILGTPENPVALISIYDLNAETGEYEEREPALRVVHSFNTIEKVEEGQQRSAKRSYEQRAFDTQATVTGRTIRGYASVFNSLSEDLGGFREIIAPGAFSDVLNDDVRALYNHSPDYLLARTSNGTLQIGQDERGLWYEFEAPNTSYANDIIELMKRGDLRESSFGFIVAKDSWRMRDGKPFRTIEKVGSLLDVSPVVYPAYPAATSGLRSAEPSTEEKAVEEKVEETNIRFFINRLINLTKDDF